MMTTQSTKKSAKKLAKRKQKKNGEIRLVSGVRMKHANEAQLDISCEKLEIPAGGSLDDKVRRVASFFQAQKADDYDLCGVCGGMCLSEILEPLIGECCPYCGDGPGAKAKVIAIEKSNGEKPVELVVADGVEVVEGTEGELDDACKQVAKLKINLAKGFWHLGQVIAEIHERKLWQYRIGPDNASLYTSFEAFVRSELNMSDDQAYNYLQVYRAFTEDDLREIGVSKLKLILGLPPGPLRDKLLAAARNGASKRKIKKEIDDSEDDGEPETDKITVVLAMGSVRLPMWKRKAAGKKQDAEPEPARSVKDDAFCEELLANGVTQTYRLVQKRTGQMELIIERSRIVE